jgi:V8-like Glu-specific endopeptidase
MSQRVRALSVLALAGACGGLLLSPTSVGAAAIARPPAGLAPAQAPTPSGTGQPFNGVAAVGALFTMNSGTLGTHFCTATVVHSPHGDLAVTAAHCVAGQKGQIAFVPGYANGRAPLGVWLVTGTYTDKAWQSSHDPDHDVAFLRLSHSHRGVPVEDVTGAERLGADTAHPALVQVIGYPDDADRPVLCANSATLFSPTQLKFDCDGYTDGTSGGPFLADVSASSGQGTIAAVIGGYEEGGDTPDVSYGAAFGPAVATLFRSAEAAG